ncbi:kinase-like domain-containing protein [Fomitopsis serialis]|uniref:kinase-like domain-containing protein n=1 Tax=Fomitopsis serialis TaxID=139415 RepID=UPI002008A622|nr:kinase-like domain-containing protein [Neoantrodia serialis]KAH9930871.1 kinase-like domain-containing protein [Neoantrodia serialis]
MTNTPSGSKRPYEGTHDRDYESHKRPRGREDARDWKDVHLKSPPKPRSSRHDYRPRSREHDHRRAPSDYGRDRDRDRDRDRRDDRDRDELRREDPRRRTRSPPRNSRRNGSVNGHAQSNGHAHPKDDSEREEGDAACAGARDGAGSYNESVSVEETLAARRAKRQAILAKYAGTTSAALSQGVSPSPGPSSAVEPPPTSPLSNNASQSHSPRATPALTDVDRSASVSGMSGMISKRDSVSASPTPGTFSLAKDQGDGQVKGQVQDGPHEQISAADYDPSLDRREDEKRVLGVKDKPTEDIQVLEEVEEEEEDDVDDMFAIATTDKKPKKVRKLVKRPAAPALITTTLDSAADAEGYYQVILGEQLDGGRYQVFSHLGKGMFANVVRARVLDGEPGEAGKEVAIKIVRCQESMYKAGLKEAQILNKLKLADLEDKKHVVRLERTFEHRGHLCLVFESLSMNLRDVVKRFGKDVGLNLKAVRAYAHQLFLAMSLLRKCNIMHADIKPDNILVNDQKTLLKLCDLGSASDASENEITPYLVSRFYRAPEIILGVPYDPALDIWSIGCTLYELYTGKILFPGRSNNQMLLLMMELKGRFNSKMIKRARFGSMYFDELGAFQSIETERVTGSDVIRQVHITAPTRDLRQRLMPPASVKMKDDEGKLLTSFIDLLDKCLALDPTKRISPKEALVHPFIRG